MTLYTVSQIARRTGITVRTLHHYEAKGLLTPAHRSDAGYRLYGEAELKRLQHIVSLKALGFLACANPRQPGRRRAVIRRSAATPGWPLAGNGRPPAGTVAAS